MGVGLGGRGSGRAGPSQAPHLREEEEYGSRGDEETYSDYTYAEESEEEEAAERDSELSPSIVRPGAACQAALCTAARRQPRRDLPSAVRPRGSVVTFAPAVAPRAADVPRAFPGSVVGRSVVWPLEAEKIYFEMAEQLKRTNMSGYTQEFDKRLFKRLQEQEGQIGLSFVPTLHLRQDAVAEILKVMGIKPTKPPGGQLYR